MVCLVAAATLAACGVERDPTTPDIRGSDGDVAGEGEGEGEDAGAGEGEGAGAPAEGEGAAVVGGDGLTSTTISLGSPTDLDPDAPANATLFVQLGADATELVTVEQAIVVNDLGLPVYASPLRLRAIDPETLEVTRTIATIPASTCTYAMKQVVVYDDHIFVPCLVSGDTALGVTTVVVVGRESGDVLATLTVGELNSLFVVGTAVWAVSWDGIALFSMRDAEGFTLSDDELAQMADSRLYLTACDGDHSDGHFFGAQGVLLTCNEGGDAGYYVIDAFGDEGPLRIDGTYRGPLAITTNAFVSTELELRQLGVLGDSTNGYELTESPAATPTWSQLDENAAPANGGPAIFSLFYDDDGGEEFVARFDVSGNGTIAGTASAGRSHRIVSTSESRAFTIDRNMLMRFDVTP